MELHRIGSTPAQRGSLSNGTCPDLLLTTDGSVAVIGAVADPKDLGLDIGPGQRVVIVPRRAMIDAMRDHALDQD